MAFYRRRFGRARSGYSRTARSFGYRRRSFLRRYSSTPRPFVRGLSLARRSTMPRTVTLTNTWDGGVFTVGPSTSDTTWSTQWFLQTAGFFDLAQRFSQYRIEKVSVTLTPGWSTANIDTFPGGVAGPVAQPYVVTALTVGEGRIPGAPLTCQNILGMDNALRTDGSRVHSRTFRPAPAAPLWVSGPTFDYGHPGGYSGLRSVWISTSYAATPHGVLHGAIRSPQNVSSEGSLNCAYRVTYSMTASFRGWRGDLSTTPLVAAAAPAPRMVDVHPASAWIPPPEEVPPVAAPAPAFGGAGAPPALSDAEHDMSELADEMAGASLRRTDRPLRPTPGTRAAAARKAAPSMGLFAPKA